MDVARPERLWVPSLACAAMLVALGVGFAVRLHGLERNGITHAEVYVPRLTMPEWVDAPPPRRTFEETTFGTLYHDNHPPGYYAFMWAWTGLAGTGLRAIRLPAALAGGATIALLYWLARRRDGEGVALTAATLLALHGHHVFWSQQARMWVFLGFLGVLSVLLLQRFYARPRSSTAAAYVCVVCAGLWFEYSFWPFFLAQAVWTLCRNADSHALPAAFQLQLLALVLSSPVLGFLVVHLGLGRTEYLARTGALEHLGGFLLLQWLLRPPEPPAALSVAASWAVVALLVAGATLLIVGVVRSPASEPLAEASADPPALPLGLTIAASLAASLCCLRLYRRGAGDVAFAVVAALPWLLLAAGVAGKRRWSLWARWIRAFRGDRLRRRITEDAATMHAIVPLAILLLASIWVPSVAARSLLFLTPFALILVARGLFAGIPRPGWRILPLLILLAAAVVSVGQYARWGLTPVDEQTLALAMQPLMRPADVVLINQDWRTQPMYYYFPADRYHTGDFGDHLAGLRSVPRLRPDRVWVVVLSQRDARALGGVSPYLRGHREARRVTTANAYAVLFERRRPSR